MVVKIAMIKIKFYTQLKTFSELYIKYNIIKCLKTISFENLSNLKQLIDNTIDKEYVFGQK